jgi:hypothetical protein
MIYASGPHCVSSLPQRLYFSMWEVFIQDVLFRVLRKSTLLTNIECR